MTEVGRDRSAKGRPRDTLTSDRVDQIIGLIGRWSKEWEKLTGDSLAGRVKTCLGFNTTRPALLNSKTHAKVREAYDRRVDELYGPKKAPTPRPVEEEVLRQRVDRLMKENDDLRAENDALKQRFYIWIGNARRKGLSDADLNAPLAQARADQNGDKN